MNDTSVGGIVLNELAHEFVERYRRGQKPALSEYTNAHPELASEIQSLFPALLVMEELGSISPVDHLDGTQVPIPRQLGEYQILRQIGRGGMGVVYEAVQESLGRHVALKVLPSRDAASGQRLERFRREACAAARLHHTNIVPVFGVSEDNGVHYYAMQFIHGQTLDKVLAQVTALRQRTADCGQSGQRSTSRDSDTVVVTAEGEADWGSGTQPSVRQDCATASPNSVDLDSAHTVPLPASSSSNLPSSAVACDQILSASSILGSSRAAYYQIVARIGAQAADALAYAHAQGVLHRDIKPANLLLDTRGTIWITDFGLARIEGLAELTMADDVVGTLRYIPPERFRGQTDTRGDVYSLGVTLYEMLVLQAAFEAPARAEVIHRILSATLTPPRHFDRHIPRDLETIVLKATARDPDCRYQSAAEMADDLRRFLADRPIEARRLSAAERSWRWCRGNKALACSIAIATILLCAVATISSVASVTLRTQLRQTRLAKREARERLFDSLVSQAHARWQSGEKHGRRFETLAVLREAASLGRDLQLPTHSFRQLRDEAIAALCLPDEEIAQLVDAWPVGTAMVDFDPDLQRYARGDIEGNITIHRIPDNHILHRLPSPGPRFELEIRDGAMLSPNGGYLQQRCHDEHDPQRSGRMRLWDVSADQPRLVFEIPEGVSGLTAFAPDSRHLAVTICEPPPTGAEAPKPIYRVHVFEAASGREVATPLRGDETTRVVFHPTQRQLAVSDVSAVRIVRWDTGAELSRWELSQTTPLAWSPDQRQLLARTDSDTQIHRWDIEGQRELPPLDSRHDGHIGRIVFNHHGDRFVSTLMFRYQLWDFPSGQLLWDSTEGATSAIRFSQDDQLLAGFHGVYPQVRILRVASGLELRRLPMPTPVGDGFPKAVITQDGRILAATSQSGTVLLDPQRNEQLAVIPGIRIPLAFEPDGALLTHADAPEGVVRWPIINESSANARVLIGPPQSLTESQHGPEQEPSLFAGLETWSSSINGRVIASPWQQGDAESGANVFIADVDIGLSNKYRRVELGPQHDVRWMSVSPNGKWVATGSVSWLAKSTESTNTVTIWEAATGQRIKDLLVGEGFPQFSPDGKWLAVSSSGFPECVRLWRAGSWEPGPTLSPVPGPGQAAVAFDAESHLMAMQGTTIRLVIPETGTEVACLSIPEETSLAPQCFTPDGTQLIAFGVHNGQLYIWDLRRIRQQLAELGLDWDAPPYDSSPN